MHETSTFIAHDYCGWNEQYGRYTVIPEGDTLVCRPDMVQREWDRAQLDFLSRFPGRTVHKCYEGPYRPTGNTLGTTEEICERLRKRLGSNLCAWSQAAVSPQ